MKPSNTPSSLIEETFRRETRGCMNFCRKTEYVCYLIQTSAALTNCLNLNLWRVCGRRSLTSGCVRWRKRARGGCSGCRSRRSSTSARSAAATPTSHSGSSTGASTTFSWPKPANAARTFPACISPPSSHAASASQMRSLMRPGLRKTCCLRQTLIIWQSLWIISSNASMSRCQQLSRISVSQILQQPNSLTVYPRAQLVFK